MYRLPIKVLAFAGLFAAAACDGHLPAQTAGGAGTLASQLLADRSRDWVTLTTQAFRIHTLRGSSAAHDLQVLADSVRVVRSELLQRFEANGTTALTPAHIFVFTSREDIRRLTGTPLMGFAQQGEPTVVFAYSPGSRISALFRHELAHLYTFQLWGPPRTGRWLVEGVGVWAAGRCHGHLPDALAAGALARGELVPLTKLASDFDQLREDIKMPEAGSVVAFLVRRGGIRMVRELWSRDRSAEHPLGRDGATTERAWLRRLSAVRPATMDISRLIREGC